MSVLTDVERAAADAEDAAGRAHAAADRVSDDLHELRAWEKQRPHVEALLTAIEDLDRGLTRVGDIRELTAACRKAGL